jgi:hypothetical protein
MITARAKGVAGALAAFAAAVFFLGAAPSDPSGEQILRNIEAARAGVKDYTVMVNIVADVERLKVPPMKAKMYFKHPDKVHFDSKGFALLPREGLVLNVENLIKSYSVTGMTRDTLGGVPEYTLDLRALSEKTRIQRLAVTANPARWTIDRVQIRRGGDRLMTMDFQYEQRGTFWLPVDVVATLGIPSDSTETAAIDPSAPVRQQMPRKGKITLKFFEYQVNTGLSDSIFVGSTNN